MRIVSSQTDADLERDRATQQVQRTARELAANVLRVVRGAGRPVEIARQAVAYVNASQAHFDAHGRWPSSELHEMLSLDDPRDRQLTGENLAFASAEATMVSGALQVAASQLLGQMTQRAAGEREIYDGIREREAALAARLELKAKKPASRTRTKTTRKKLVASEPQNGFD